MRYLAPVLLLLAACGVEVETDIPEQVEIPVGDAIEEVGEAVRPQIRIVNREVYLKYGDWCFAIDRFADYPLEWIDFPDVDGYRGDYDFGERYWCNYDNE